MSAIVEGEVRAPFQAVRDVLQANLDRGTDVGFSFAAYRDGAPIAELWGGYADAERRRPWTAQTLVPLTSISKTVFAATLWRLFERGAVDLHAPVARYWPAFGAYQKSEISIADVLAHRAGIPWFSTPVTLQDEVAWTPIVERLEQARPVWPPGSAHGYHAIVLGFLLSELIRRIVDKPASAAVRELILEPIDADLHVALSPDAISNLAEILPPAVESPPIEVPPAQRDYVAGFLDPESTLHRATFGSTAMTFADLNNADYYTTERPAAYGTASATARMFAALIGEVEGVRLIAPDTVALATAERSSGCDRVFAVPTRWAAGFMLPGGPLWPQFGRPAFGHIGSTGALAFADPSARLAFAYLPNRRKSIFEIPDRRAEALTRSIYTCLGAA